MTSKKSVDIDYDTMLDEDSVIDEILIVGPTYYKSKKNSTNADCLSKTLKISQEDAQITIDNATQRCVRQADPRLKSNYSTNDRMLRYKRLDECFFIDTFCAKKSKSLESLHQNTCCQLFVTDKSYVFVCPLEKESDVLLSFKLFAKDVGVPEALVTDCAKAETSAEVKKFCINIGTTLKILEQGTPWTNLAELHIRILKSATSKDVTESNSPCQFAVTSSCVTLSALPVRVNWCA